MPAPRRTSYDGVEVIELFTRGADASAPLVVAMHGLGDRPEAWVSTWRAFPARAHIALPRAFDPAGDGYSWFPIRVGDLNDPALASAVGAAEERLWRGLASLAGGRRPIVTGFSQGGILAFVLAARRATRITHALPVAGFCPDALLPTGDAPARVTAFHGTEDAVIGVSSARRSVAAFRARGGAATLREFPGVVHAITEGMRGELWQAIADSLSDANARSPSPGR
jgi:phospholipase/carboxylesterase